MDIACRLFKLTGPLTEKSEISQSFTRLIVVTIVLLDFLLHSHYTQLIYIAFAYLIASSVWHYWIKLDPLVQWRKYASLVFDQVVITTGLWIGGPTDVGLLFLYCWVIIGYGYRFGSYFVLYGGGVAFVGVSSLVLFSGAWTLLHHHAVELVIIFTLVTLFKYRILNNLEDETHKAEVYQAKAAQFENKSNRDSLTKLCNREYAENWLMEKHKSNSRVSILFLDLDNFKEFNDDYGHHVGDQVLINISKRLENSIRVDDIVCRYAGDEFIILVNDEDEDTITEIGDRITEALNQAVELEDGQRLTVTASIGVAIMGIDGDGPTNTLKNADAAMYMAKRKGRNRVAWYKEKVKG